jgi:hypothetical protein
MKKSQLLVILMLLIPLTFMSCGDDSEDGSATKQAILGTWYSSGCYKYITFNSDGTIDYSRTVYQSVSMGSGKYSVSGKTITYSFDVVISYGDGTSQTQNWHGSNMYYSDTDNTIEWAGMIYQRVN